MKLLVLAQTPPPLHGQSLMVQTAVEGLPQHGIEVHHVNLRLSRSHADIGGWRLGKVFAAIDACLHAIVMRFTQGCDALYYVPAPGKRGALYRDWLVMALCRPFFPKLILHFHNGGLGEWIDQRLTLPERAITRLLLGRADLGIVLTESLRVEAVALGARRIAIVPNGIADPGPPRHSPEPGRILFIGAVSREKGALELLDAVRILRTRGIQARAVFAGSVAPRLREIFASARRTDPECCEMLGFIGSEAKAREIARATCVCLPTSYAHEAQPLVALEAMASDRAVVATRWRGLPETLPKDAPLTPPGDAHLLADALGQVLARPLEPGKMRAHYLEHYSRERHLAVLAATLNHSAR